MRLPIYLDNAASTPIDPRVAAKMTEYLTTDVAFGNPSSSHIYGKLAKEAIEKARQQIADLIHAETSEIIWTSGATEANNLGIKGAAQIYKSKGKHIVTIKSEHPAVLDSCQQLEKEGFFVTYLAPEKNGVIDLDKLKNALREDTILVSVMHVNNEIGVIQDIESIAQITSQKGILFHVDAVQSAGKLPINVGTMPIDMISFAAHKIYGPKGIGALYLRRKPRVRVMPQSHGGGQEQGMRSGTLPTHQIVGMGEAFHIAKNEIEADRNKATQLREQFWQGICDLKNVSVNGEAERCIPNILSVRFAGKTSMEIIQSLPNLAISAGSACHSKGIEPSYILRAMGQTVEEASGAVRFSFGRFNTAQDIDFAIKQIKDVFVGV